MRPLAITILVLAVINTVIGICNIFFVSSEYKQIGNMIMFSVVFIEMILGSIIIHSPDGKSK